MPKSDLTPLQLQLIEMWKQGVSASVIGSRLGITKNAVVGHANRLRGRGFVEGRPSPIKQSAPKPIVAPQRRAGPVTLQSLPSIATPMSASVSMPKLEPVVHPMPPQSEIDHRIIDLRHIGLSWAAVARNIGITVDVAKYRGDKLGLVQHTTTAKILAHNRLRQPQRNKQTPPQRIDRSVEHVYANPVRSPVCLFPLWGDKEKATHVYCDQPTAAGVFCAKHCAICFRRSSSEAA